jgi:hypothetical protein
MPKIIIDSKSYELKTSFELLSFGEYKRLLINNESSNRNRLNVSVLANMPIELVHKISDAQLAAIVPHIAFIAEPSTIKCIEADKKYLKSIGEEPWIKLETAKMHIKLNGDKDILFVIDQIVEIYTGENILDWPLQKAMTVINHYIEELNAFFETFKKLNEYKPETAELLAGIRQLDYLGFYLTLDALTQSDITKREQVKNMPAFEVHNQLLINYENAQYQKRLVKTKEKTK